MLTHIDSLLNRITMYRLVLYYLLTLIVIAGIFGAFKILPYDPVSLGISCLVIFLVCWIINVIFAKAFNMPANVESFYITAFILTLIISPVNFLSTIRGGGLDGAGFAFLVWASIFAITSKYIFAIGKKHIFNPAAIAIVITGFALNQYASWWVGGNLPLLAFVLVGGLLVVRKIQRFDLVITFFVASIVSILATSATGPGAAFDPLSTIYRTIIHTSILFFAFVMITEPMTTPPTRLWRIAYGALVGILFSPGVHFGSVYSTPELALVVGNIFSYAVSPKGKYILKLKSKEKISEDTYDFIFAPEKKVKFRPGQYMEWTLTPAGADLRGNRRYFTIASSPTESNLHLGVKFVDHMSTFKKNLISLGTGEQIVAGQLAGDFTLPSDASKKLVFIAGGIGITPFRSMIKYMVDVSDRRSAILFYSNRNTSEIAYKEIFDEAERTIGLKTIYAITDDGAPMPGANIHSGRIDAALIMREVPDYRERLFYISGPHAMVVAFEKTLHELGIPRIHIRTDFFPGFV